MAERSRVLHVAEAFGGGVMEMIRIVAEAGVQAGSSQAIAYGRRPETPIDPRCAFDPAVDLIDLDWHRTKPLTHLGAGRKLRALCRSHRPDVVHLHSSFAGAIGIVALRRSVPLVYTPHAYASSIETVSWHPSSMLRSVERVISRHVDVVGAVSETEAQIARDLRARRVVCIPNGIPELDAVRGTTPAPHLGVRPRVIAIGRLSDQRRPEACARIFSAVADLADVGWVGGAGSDAANGGVALAALTAVGAPPTGWVSRETVLEELRQAGVYLHWTEWDGRAMSMLEAIACDAVVVASDTPPNREVLDSRQLCGSEQQAIDLIRRIVKDEVFAGELLADQRNRASQHSASEMTRRWLELYDELS